MIGRSWLSKMKVKLNLSEDNTVSLNSVDKVCHLDKSVTLDEDVQLLINSHVDLFAEGLGTYRSKINMKVEPGTTAIFRRSIPVPKSNWIKRLIGALH